jgi:hypothetical protein
MSTSGSITDHSKLIIPNSLGRTPKHHYTIIKIPFLVWVKTFFFLLYQYKNLLIIKYHPTVDAVPQTPSREDACSVAMGPIFAELVETAFK